MGPALLILNPARGQTGPTLELRYIDMREVFVDMNVIAEPPEGETYQKHPAVFKKVDTTLPSLDVRLQGKGEAFDLSVQYGNRQAMVTLTRYQRDMKASLVKTAMVLASVGSAAWAAPPAPPPPPPYSLPWLLRPATRAPSFASTRPWPSSKTLPPAPAAPPT